jgi:hypothetical protein
VVVLSEWPGARSAVAIPLIIVAVAMIVLGDRATAKRGEVHSGT